MSIFSIPVTGREDYFFINIFSNGTLVEHPFQSDLFLLERELALPFLVGLADRVDLVIDVVGLKGW